MGMRNFSSQYSCDTHIYTALKLHCYIYYLAYYEKEDIAGKKLIDSARKFIQDKDIKKIFCAFVKDVAESDSNVLRLHIHGRRQHNIFNSCLRTKIENDLERFEYLSEMTVKQMVMGDAVDDFVTFLACYIGNVLHNYRVLNSIISPDDSTLFYLKYAKNEMPLKKKPLLKRFFTLMNIPDQENGDLQTTVISDEANSNAEGISKVQVDVEAKDNVSKKTDTAAAIRSAAAYAELIKVIEMQYKTYTLSEAKKSTDYPSEEYQKQKSQVEQELADYLSEKFKLILDRKAVEEADDQTIVKNQGRNIYQYKKYGNLSLFTFCLPVDMNIEEIINERFDFIFVRICNYLGDKLFKCGLVEELNKDQMSDESWIEFLKKHKDDIIIGADSALDASDITNYEVVHNQIEYSGLRVPPIRDRIPANRAMIPLCFQ